MPGSRASMPNGAAPVDLERRVEALARLADQLELVGRLDRRLRGERDLGRVGRELAEGAERPEASCRTVPSAAVHAPGATSQCAAAAAISRARARWRRPAAARRASARTERLPPVPID